MNDRITIVFFIRSYYPFFDCTFFYKKLRGLKFSQEILILANLVIFALNLMKIYAPYTLIFYKKFSLFFQYTRDFQQLTANFLNFVLKNLGFLVVIFYKPLSFIKKACKRCINPFEVSNCLRCQRKMWGTCNPDLNFLFYL